MIAFIDLIKCALLFTAADAGNKEPGTRDDCSALIGMMPSNNHMETANEGMSRCSVSGLIAAAPPSFGVLIGMAKNIHGFLHVAVEEGSNTAVSETTDSEEESVETVGGPGTT